MKSRLGKRLITSDDAYWQCLAVETKRNFTRNLSGTDFELFIRGTCKDEAQRFRVAMIDYLALKFPQISAAMHFSSADTAIRAAIEDMVSGYIELKNPRR